MYISDIHSLIVILSASILSCFDICNFTFFLAARECGFLATQIILSCFTCAHSYISSFEMLIFDFWQIRTLVGCFTLHHYYISLKVVIVGFIFLLNLLHMQVDESWTLVVCLIYTPSALRPSCFGLTLYTRQTTRAHATTITYNSIK